MDARPSPEVIGPDEQDLAIAVVGPDGDRVADATVVVSGGSATLAAVERDETISEIAGKLDHSESYTSRAIADLAEKGFVYKERDGRRKRVIPSNARG